MISNIAKEQATTNYMAQMNKVAALTEKAIAAMNKVNALVADCVAQGMPASSNLANTTLRDNLIAARTELANEQKYIVAQAKEIAFSLPVSVNSPYYSTGGEVPPAVPSFAATKASATVGTNTFTAVTAGLAGNSIALVFNGTDTVSAVTTAWNTANGSNQVSFTGLGTNVIAASTVTLSGAATPSSPPTAYTAPAVIT